MIIDVKRLPLVQNSTTVVGAALKILQAGGSDLNADQMKRAMGSAYLFTTHKREILDLLGAMETSAKD